MEECPRPGGDEDLSAKRRVPVRRAILESDTLGILQKALDRLDAGFRDLPSPKSRPVNIAAISKVLADVSDRLANNYPYFHPLYAGQMLKPPHPVARLAYALAMWLNPNNHALDGGRASSAMEKEAVAELAAMVGWERHLGHLTSGGTMANLEALWVAGRIKEGAAIIASEQAHYTHGRISGVLGLKFESVPSDARGRMDIAALRDRLAKGGVGTIVATLGTTATGSVDPLPEILSLRNQFGFRLHADAAYGGYFTLVDNLDSPARAAFDCMKEADSIVIDPHKHGLQPYGCGCVVFKDPSVGTLYKHESPYTYFSSGDLHLGEISLECSRAGAAAVGLWATQKLLPLKRGGEFAAGLGDGRRAALAFHRHVMNDRRFIAGMEPELDIVTWIPRAESVSKASLLSRAIFDDAAKKHLHLALAELPVSFFSPGATMVADRRSITAFRSVLMKPEHLEWLDDLWSIFDKAATAVLKRQS